MRSVIMIIFEIRTKHAFQMSLVQDDDMICALSPDRADHSFNKRVLPRAARGRDHFFDAHVFHSTAEENAIDRIPIPHQILRPCLPRKGFNDLLGCPLGTRIELTLKWTTVRRLWRMITRTNRILKVAVGTVKKSIEHLLA